MTCNQLMVLLDIYRGTFESERHVGTVTQDVDYLTDKKLIRRGSLLMLKCTIKGSDLVNWLLNYD